MIFYFAFKELEIITLFLFIFFFISKVNISPSKFDGPIGFQKKFTCKYEHENGEDLNITTDGLNIHHSNYTKYQGGASLTFYHVVGCYETKITCRFIDKNGKELGHVVAVVFPGLRIPFTVTIEQLLCVPQ